MPVEQIAVYEQGLCGSKQPLHDADVLAPIRRAARFPRTKAALDKGAGGVHGGVPPNPRIKEKEEEARRHGIVHMKGRISTAHQKRGKHHADHQGHGAGGVLKLLAKGTRRETRKPLFTTLHECL